MAKRFTDTEIWEQDWYIDLPTKYKLTWNYIKDKCDNCGIWRPNKSLLQRIIGEPVNLEEFLTFVNVEKGRITVLPTGRWFLRDFFIFQYGDKFSPTSQIHKGAIKQLVANGVHPKEILGKSIGEIQNYDLEEVKEIAYSKDINILLIAYNNPYQRVKDKVKDKDYVLSLTNAKKSKNETGISGNFKARGEEILGNGYLGRLEKAKRLREEDNSGEV
jgi:hypothetical protein